MRRLAETVAIALLATRAPALACKLVPATVLPLHLEDGGRRMSTDARLNGKILHLTVDTGSDYLSLLRKDLPDESQFFTRGHMIGVGAGTTASEFGTVHGLQLGRLKADVMASVDAQDLHQVGVQDGLLGMSVLGGYDLDFDLPDSQLRLFTSVGDCSHPTAFLTGDLVVVPELQTGSNEPTRLQPRIMVTIGGKQFPALVDTGSTISLISREAALSVGVTDAMLAADRHNTGHAIGGAMQAALHQFHELDVGDLVFQNPRLAVAKMAGGTVFKIILGTDFLSRTHFWISNSSETIIFQVPPAPSPPLPKGMAE